MKATVQFESPHTGKAISCRSGGSDHHHSKGKQPAAAANGFQNHLELRLGISAADSFGDTVAVSAGYHAGTHGCSGGSCCGLYLTSGCRHSPEELVLHRDKSILNGDRLNAVAGEHAKIRHGAEDNQRQLSSCGDQTAPMLPPNELALHQNKRSKFNLNYHQPRGVDGLCFDPQMPSGFIHPWSLAARQQKAAIEKAQRNHNDHSSSPMPRVSGPPTSPLVVGWPPICASRKNLVHQDPFKLEMEVYNNSRRMRNLMETEQMIDTDAGNPTMFVKVNMEDYCIGRKIDLKMHRNYDSLHHALLKLSRSFLSSSCLKEPDELEDNDAPEVVFLYEDYEGDKMLVGDVPWRLFINSVKRLYIVAKRSKKSTDHDNGSEAAGNPENK